MQASSIPNDWYCPITQEIMTDPVVGSDGHSYQRKAIVEWLKKNPISPVTRENMDPAVLINNIALKSTIAHYLPEGSKLASEVKKKIGPAIQNDVSAVAAVTAEEAKPDTNVKMEYDVMEYGPHIVVSVTVTPPDITDMQKRKKISIVAAIDRSYSMIEEVIVRSNGQKELSDGFTRFDLVQHSLNCIIEVLGDEDELALIVFNDTASVISPFLKMTSQNKTIIRNKMRQVHPDKMTNLWAPLQEAFKLTKAKPYEEDRNVVVVMLTDGQPNSQPLGGTLNALKTYIQKEKIIPNIHIFGYGYAIDSQCLQQLCQNGVASFSFIPDATLLGSTFINFFSNVLSMYINPVRLTFDVDTQKTKLYRTFGRNDTSNIVQLSHLQYGQSRNQVIIVTKGPDLNNFMKVTLEYGDNYKYSKTMTVSFGPTRNRNKAMADLNRWVHVDGLRKARADVINRQGAAGLQIALEDIKKARQFQIKSGVPDTDRFTQGLVEEFSYFEDPNRGQVRKSFYKKEWYERWGQHYLPHLISAHTMQLCTNNRDAGTQLYGGQMFRAFQKEIQKIYEKLPAVKPSIKKVVPPPIDLTEYVRYGGCIAGHCLVKMNDGNTKMVRDIRKGDLVFGGHAVCCVLKTTINDVISMAILGSLVITPYHPVKIQHTWKFPADIAQVNKIYVSDFYNFVLDSGHSISVDGVECVTLAHNLQDGVVKHEYLGSSRILKDLQGLPGWSSGHIDVLGFRRDASTNLICGIIT